MVAICLFGGTDTRTDLVRAIQERPDVSTMVYVDDGTRTAPNWSDAIYTICSSWDAAMDWPMFVSKPKPFYAACLHQKKDRMFKNQRRFSKWSSNKPNIKM